MGCQSITLWCNFGLYEGKNGWKNKVEMVQEYRYVHKDGKIKAKSSNQTKVINWNVSPFPRNSLLMSHMSCLLMVLKWTYRKSDLHACTSAGPEGPGIVNHLCFLHNKLVCCVYVSRCFVRILLRLCHHSCFWEVLSMSSILNVLSSY